MWLTIILFLYSIILTVYFIIQRHYSYWESQGIPCLKANFPFGNVKELNTTEHPAQTFDRFYKAFKGKGPIGGIYTFLSPAAVVTDLEMVKTILIKDFNYFINRGGYYNEKDDPISANLFNIDDPQWKKLRTKLSPTFTSGKMKYMSSIIIDVGNDFVKCMDREIKESEIIEMKDILARFTTDVIGSCAFGIDCQSLVNPNTEFRIYGKKAFDAPNISRQNELLIGTFPYIAQKLHIKRLANDISKFFFDIVKQTIEYREKNNIIRNDFMNLLIQLKNKGKLDDDTSGKETGFLTINEITAQSWVFFAAGFETSSTAMSYALYELALNKNIQDRARREINDVLAKFNGEFNYESIMEMKYIEQIMNESLRKYPPLPILTRIVNQDYKIPNSSVILKKGMRIFIPGYSFQHDAEFYPNPEVFNPDRFSDEGTRKRNPYSFLAFGDGPRNCIGLRFGMLQARIGMAKLLANFKFLQCSKTVKQIQIEPTAFIYTSQGGCFLKVERL